MPWSDCLMPLAKNYLALERCVYECAYAGCETIWIIANRELTPFIRRRLGDWVYDPTINKNTILNVKFNLSDQLKSIPIYYVPIGLRDKEIRMSMSYSILFGYRRIVQITKAFSRWASPSKYYVSFPFGVLAPSQLQKFRSIISSKKSIFIQSPEGKTIKDGEHLSFTFDGYDYRSMRKNFQLNENIQWKEGSYWQGGLYADGGRFKGKKLSAKENRTGRFISIPTILESLSITEDNTIPVTWFFDISTWDKYRTFLGSEKAGTLKRPSSFLKYREFNKIAENIDDRDSSDIKNMGTAQDDFSDEYSESIEDFVMPEDELDSDE